MSSSITRIVAAGIAGIALAAGGCSADDGDDQSASTPATTAPAASDESANASAMTDSSRDDAKSGADNGGTNEGSSTATGTRTGNGCPVSAKALFEVLKANNDLYSRVNDSTTGLKDVTCVQGYATAITVVENADPIAVLFKYKSSTQTWKALNIGSSHVCDSYVPDSVLPRLRNCG